MGELTSGVRELIRLDESGKIPKLDYSEIADFLIKRGYGITHNKGDFELKSLKIIKIEDSIASEISKNEISALIKYHLPANAQNLWYSESKLSGNSNSFYVKLPKFEIINFRDGKDAVNLFFNNCIVVIGKNKIEYKTYKEFDFNGCVIWRSSISKHNFHKSELDNWNKNDWYNFSKNAVGEKSLPYLMRALGYMIHSYKDKTFAKMVVFAEAEDTGGRSGGTGKGLQIRGLAKFRALTDLDGKNFDPSNQFNFSAVEDEHQIIVLNDVNLKFNYEHFYSKITDGFTRRRLHRNAVIVPFKESPKWIVTSNYGVSGVDASDMRRRIVITFTNYYSDTHTPKDETDKDFFDDWDEIEYSKFFSYYIRCCQMYLNESACSFNDEGMYKKGIKFFTDEEFISFLELNNDIFKNLNRLPEDYRNDMQEAFKFQDQQKFNRKFETAVKHLGFKILKQKKCIKDGRHRMLWTIVDKEVFNNKNKLKEVLSYGRFEKESENPINLQGQTKKESKEQRGFYECPY